MPDLVGSFQTCAVRGHSIQQNLWLMRDLVEYVMDRDLPCALVSLDQEKAFDMVDHGFLSPTWGTAGVSPVTSTLCNPTKTKGLRLGKWRSKQLPFAASWVDDAIKINGIWFGYGSPESLTWNEKVDLVEARLKDFGDRYISLLGKVTVINRFVYPLLWYPGTVLAAPEGVLVRLERAVFRFLWSGKTELVRRKVLL
ncbi:hypothetical protein HOLleu_44417 [Holothuria leucospilota]|uniref:Reverse transcriptase domain-containing protein n=1 Tax=Holothuria leucospilota TaxID=206669 RepID=A0A9Q0YAQ2_HOLLE|nr:hypothetical protein HOLleu_44417 [Holothuria leucospilota]